jgi:hypothetical protein
VIDEYDAQGEGDDWQKGKLLEQQERPIIEATLHWASSVVLWNLALN